MNNPKYRFLLYSITGLVFGIIDWFYLDWLAHFSWGQLGQSIYVVPIILIMNFGIWLLPILPVVAYESRITNKIRYPITAGILTWSGAIFSYYAYYAILLSLGKLPHLEHLNIFGVKSETFWYEYWQMFKGIILGQFTEWIIIAVIGGAILGAFSYWLSHKKGILHLESR